MQLLPQLQELRDTAGLRQTDDVIEKLGIEQSYMHAAQADILLLVFDGSRPLATEEIILYAD